MRVIVFDCMLMCLECGIVNGTEIYEVKYSK